MIGARGWYGDYRGRASQPHGAKSDVRTSMSRVPAALRGNAAWGLRLLEHSRLAKAGSLLCWSPLRSLDDGRSTQQSCKKRSIEQRNIEQRSIEQRRNTVSSTSGAKRDGEALSELGPADRPSAGPRIGPRLMLHRALGPRGTEKGSSVRIAPSLLARCKYLCYLTRSLAPPNSSGPERTRKRPRCHHLLLAW